MPLGDADRLGTVIDSDATAVWPGETSPFPATDRAGVASATPLARTGMRDGTVAAYLIVAAIILAPGLLLAWLPPAAIDHGETAAWLQFMRGQLADIRFGSGVRFWLGVLGATMMALLIVYPFRKGFAKVRWLGSVSVWFHIHMLFGIFGPVFILYHCNFGFGGRNANVALGAMLMIAASGIIGHFVYANASATFYSHKQKAREQLDAIADFLAKLGVMHMSRQRLIGELEALDADLLTPRKGVVASVQSRFRMERKRRHLARSLSWHLAQAADLLDVGDDHHERMRVIVGQHFGAYVKAARHASSRSLREQVWARWRLFHMPAFIIMVVAAGLHIQSVWNVDSPSEETTAAAVEKPVVAPAIVQAVAKTTPSDTRQRVQQSASSVPLVRNTTDAQAAVPTPRPAPLPASSSKLAISAGDVSLADPGRSENFGATSRSPAKLDDDALRQAATGIPPPGLASPKSPAPRPAALPPVQAKLPIALPAETAIATPPPHRTAPAAVAEFAELDRRIQQEKVGNLGGAVPRTLEQQIREFKELQKAGKFAHALVRTGFALTGKHVDVDCASCHKSEVLADRQQSNPRQCINCHKTDDVHRGRRPDCANCHTPNRWSEILRRK